MLPGAPAHDVLSLACLPQIVVLLGVGINLVISTSALGECSPSSAVGPARRWVCGPAGLLDDSRAKGKGPSLNLRLLPAGVHLAGHPG